MNNLGIQYAIDRLNQWADQARTDWQETGDEGALDLARGFEEVVTVLRLELRTHLSIA